MGTETLGEFEYVVLLSLARLGEGAHGTAVYDELVRVTGRDVTVPAVYITLGRMAKKGFVRTWEGEVADERGGRARKRFALTQEGAAMLRTTRETAERLWRGVRLEGLPGGDGA